MVQSWLPGQLKGSEGGRCGLLEKVKATTVWGRARREDWIVCLFPLEQIRRGMSLGMSLQQGLAQ